MGGENIFVLQSIGSIRANTGWNFQFLGRASEVPDFAPGPMAECLDNQVPYWLGTI